MTGFFSYLHPLCNCFLIEIGQQVNNFSFIGDATDKPVTQEGMKISLFDVSDPSNPVAINSIIKSSSYTPVEYDYRALSVLNNNGRYRFALPIESCSRYTDEFESLWTSFNSLMLLEVDTTSNNPQLIERGVVLPDETKQPYANGWQDRSVIHGNQVWHSTWAENAQVFGPF
ncbi:beta-propeller domain-containing protein [Paraglaciecola psychrophila]|uniref:beta-propeller domain-containing protein n=1 Tax=Paraglaciecola psychrophila TaxID=326544 RepID=UPI0009DB3E22|nr:beta-propeller domain-containing protein [Paraglaciecola psychrophila]